MDVIWDFYGLNYPSGIVHHTERLAVELSRFGYQPKLFLKEEQKRLPATEPIFLKPRIFDRFGLPKLSWCRTVGRFLKEADQSGGRKIFHALSNTNLPRNAKALKSFIKVVTIQDLIPLLPDAGVSFASRYQMRLLLPNVVNHADKIICTSRWTKDHLVSLYQQAESKAVVIANGFPGNWQFKERLEHPGINLLCVSRFEIYKRLDFILKVLSKAPENMRLTLVTDEMGIKYAEMHAKDLILAQKLLLKTKLSDQQLTLEYKNADLYVHPSLYEAFCLPVSEALSCGTPVVYTSGSGIDEFQFPKVSRGISRSATPEEWVGAIVEMHQASSAGLDDAFREFSNRVLTWSGVAKKTHDLYESLVK
jgi:glycosyltransferase involved in cell wall biosynthesis